MAIAARAGIEIFATGGIGGVHRGDNGDVSHDLVALSRTRIAVVSAGAIVFAVVAVLAGALASISISSRPTGTVVS